MNVAQFCMLNDPFESDGYTPPAGDGVFYLVEGVGAHPVTSIGQDSSGDERPNDNPCP